MYSDQEARRDLELYTSQWHDAAPFTSLHLNSGQSDFHVKVGSNGWTLILSQGGGKRSVPEPGKGAAVGVYDCDDYSFETAACREVLPGHLLVVEPVVYLHWRILAGPKVVIQGNNIGARRRAHNWFVREGQSAIQAQLQFVGASRTYGDTGPREANASNAAGGATSSGYGHQQAVSSEPPWNYSAEYPPLPQAAGSSSHTQVKTEEGTFGEAPWNIDERLEGNSDLLYLTASQPRLDLADMDAHCIPEWPDEDFTAEHPYDARTVLRKLLPDLRVIVEEQVHTLYVLTDTRPLGEIAHAKPFVAFLHNRLAHKGPHQETTSAIYYQLGPGSGMEQVHYTSAGPMLLSLIRTVLPAVHLVLMDHDTCLTCLWEINELAQLVVNSVDEPPPPPPPPQGALVPPPSLWSLGPEGKDAAVPRKKARTSVILITEEVYDANAGLVIFLGTDVPDSATGIHQLPKAGDEEPWIAEVLVQHMHNLRSLQATSTQVSPPPRVNGKLLQGQLWGTPLAGVTASSQASFLWAWDVLVRFLHYMVWADSEGNSVLTEGAPPVPTTSNLGPEWLRHYQRNLRWGAGVYEQNVLPLLRALSTDQFDVAYLPGHDCFMARRFQAAAVPPPFVHCYGRDKQPMTSYLEAGRCSTLPFALWGQEGHKPLWAFPDKAGVKHWRVIPGVRIDYGKLGIAPATGCPSWAPCSPVYTRSLAAAVLTLNVEQLGSQDSPLQHAYHLSKLSLSQAQGPHAGLAPSSAGIPQSTGINESTGARGTCALIPFFEPTLEAECFQLGQQITLEGSGLGQLLQVHSHGGLANASRDSYGPTGAPADNFSESKCEASPSKAARVLPALLRQVYAPVAWSRVLGPLSSEAKMSAANSNLQWTRERPSWPTHLLEPHPAVLTSLHIFTASLKPYTCPIQVIGFSAGSYSGAVLVMVLSRRRLPFEMYPHCTLQFQLGAIAFPPVVARALARAGSNYTQGTLYHHEGDKLCIWPVSLTQREAIRDLLDRHHIRLLWFCNGRFGAYTHNYGHLAHVLPKITEYEIDCNHQRQVVEDLVPEEHQELARAAIMAVGGLSIMVDHVTRKALIEFLNLQMDATACRRLLEALPGDVALREGVSEVELRELSRQALLQRLRSFVPATNVVPLTYTTVALHYAAITLAQFPLERCIDFVAFQANASVNSYGQGDDGHQKKVSHPRGLVDWRHAKQPLDIPRGTAVYGSLLYLVSPGLTVVELAFQYNGPTSEQFWFFHKGYAPKPGQCVHVKLGRPAQVSFTGALLYNMPHKTVPQGKPDWAVKANRPQKMQLVLPEKVQALDNVLKQASSFPVVEFSVLPHAMSRGLWTDLLKLPTLRAHCSLGVPLPNRFTRMAAPFGGQLTRRVQEFLVINHLLAGGSCPNLDTYLPEELGEAWRDQRLSNALIPQALWDYDTTSESIVPSDQLPSLDLTWIVQPQGDRVTRGAAVSAAHQQTPRGVSFPIEGIGHAMRPEEDIALGDNQGSGMLHALRLAQLLGLKYHKELHKALWSRDSHAPAILAQLLHADLTGRRSVFTTGMPGTGKTRTMALLCILIVLPGQRKVVYSTVSNEPVNSFIGCLDSMLSESHESVRAAFKRIPADAELKKGSTRLDLGGHVNSQPAFVGVWLIALTYGKLETGLFLPTDRTFTTPLKHFIAGTWLVVRDEGQQAGMPVVTRFSAQLPVSALEMWMGDLQQPVGGTSKEQQELGTMLQLKMCGLRAMRGKPIRPADVLGYLTSHRDDPQWVATLQAEEETAALPVDDTVDRLQAAPSPDPGFSLPSQVGLADEGRTRDTGILGLVATTCSPPSSSPQGGSATRGVDCSVGDPEQACLTEREESLQLGQVLTALTSPDVAFGKCCTEYQAIGLEGLSVGHRQFAPFNLILGTSMRLVPECHQGVQYTRYWELLTLYSKGVPVFRTTPPVPTELLESRPLHVKGRWLPPVSYLQIPSGMDVRDPIMDKLLGDIVLTVGHSIYPVIGDQLGLVTPINETHSKLLEYFGAQNGSVPADTGMSLQQAARLAIQNTALAQEHRNLNLSDAHDLGWCLKHYGLWGMLRNYVTVITATTAVGPTHAFTIYFSVRSTSFMGNQQGAQDRATSALTRSKGLLLIVSPHMTAGLVGNFIALAQALQSSMHLRDYWRMASFWTEYANRKYTPIAAMEALPLPDWRPQLDFQAMPALHAAEVIGQLYRGCLLLYYRSATSHPWRPTTYFGSGIPEVGNRRSKAQLRRSRITRAGRVTYQYTFAVGRFFTKHNVAYDDDWERRTLPPGQPDSVLLKPLGTLYGLPLRYMMMRYLEGEPLSAMKAELQELTGCQDIYGLPHFHPNLPSGRDRDHGPLVTIPMVRYSSENAPPLLEGDAKSVSELFGLLVTTSGATRATTNLYSTTAKTEQAVSHAKQRPGEVRNRHANFSESLTALIARQQWPPAALPAEVGLPISDTFDAAGADKEEEQAAIKIAKQLCLLLKTGRMTEKSLACLASLPPSFPPARVEISLVGMWPLLKWAAAVRCIGGPQPGSPSFDDPAYADLLLALYLRPIAGFMVHHLRGLANLQACQQQKLASFEHFKDRAFWEAALWRAVMGMQEGTTDPRNLVSVYATRQGSAYGEPRPEWMHLNLHPLVAAVFTNSLDATVNNRGPGRMMIHPYDKKVKQFRIAFRTHAVVPLPPFVKNIQKQLKERVQGLPSHWICKYLRMPAFRTAIVSVNFLEQDPDPEMQQAPGQPSAKRRQEASSSGQGGGAEPPHPVDPLDPNPWPVSGQVGHSGLVTHAVRAIAQAGNTLSLRSIPEFIVPHIYRPRLIPALEPGLPAYRLASQDFEVPVGVDETPFVRELNLCVSIQELFDREERENRPIRTPSSEEIFAAGRVLNRAQGRLSGKSTAMQLAGRRRSLEGAGLIGSIDLGINPPAPARTALVLGWEGGPYPFLSDPGDCIPINLYLPNLWEHLPAIDILLRHRYGVTLKGGRGGKETLTLRPPVVGSLHRYNERDGTVYVQHPHTVTWRSVFSAHEPPRGLDVATTAEASCLCNLLGPSVIGMDETIFYHVLSPQALEDCIREYGHGGELPGPLRVYPVPFLSAQVRHKARISWEQQQGPLTRSFLVSKENRMGWVALAQQLPGQPSPRLLVESPVPVELPETLLLPGTLYIGVPTQYYERPHYRAPGVLIGEGARGTPPYDSAGAGGARTGEQEQESQTVIEEAVEEDLHEHEVLEEVEATVENVKLEPEGFFEALAHGPTPAEAARIPPTPPRRPDAPRPARPKQGSHRKSKRKAPEAEDVPSEQQAGEQLCPWLMYARQVTAFRETFADQILDGLWTDQSGLHMPQENLGDAMPQQHLLFFPAQILEGSRHGQHLPALHPNQCVGTVANWQATVRTRLHHAQEQQLGRPCALVSPRAEPVILPQVTHAIDLRRALAVAAKEASTPLHVAIDFRVEAPRGDAPSSSTRVPCPS